MNKTLKRLGLAAVVTGLLAAGTPAQAADHTLAIGTAPGASIGRQVWLRNSCELTGAAAALNGTDTRIVEVTGLAGQQIVISWRADAAEQGWLVPTFWGNGCTTTVWAGNPTQLTNRAGTAIVVPPGTRWLVMEGIGVANVVFSF